MAEFRGKNDNFNHFAGSLSAAIPFAFRSKLMCSLPTDEISGELKCFVVSESLIKVHYTVGYSGYNYS